MANVTVVSSGSTAALTLNAETNLFSAVTTPGIYVVSLDASNLGNGDELEWRVYIKLYAGGPELLYVNDAISHVQGQPAKLSVTVPSPISIRSTVKQTAATGRVVNWALWSF